MRVFLVIQSEDQSRPTLGRWNQISTGLAAHGIKIMVVEAKSASTPHKGRVLDPLDHPLRQLDQTAQLVRLIHNGVVGPKDVLWLDDALQHGFSAICRAFSERFGDVAAWPPVFAWQHAGTADPNDFSFPWLHWMRHDEHRTDAVVTGYFVGGGSLAERMKIAGMRKPIHAVGHVFDGDAVRAQAGAIRPLAERAKRIIWSSRWDPEKDPGLFMDLAEQSGLADQDWEFVVASGTELRSVDKRLVTRARRLHMRGALCIRDRLTKPEYLALVANSQAHVMASLQDTVSYVLLEASALGTPTLAPCRLDFPETLNLDPRRLYVPGNVADAIARLRALLSSPPSDEEIREPSEHHSRTLERIAKVLKGSKAYVR